MEVLRNFVKLIGQCTAIVVIIPLSCLAFAMSDDRSDDRTKYRTVQEMYIEYKKSFPNVPDISAKDAIERKKQGKVIFVDVRKGKEKVVSTLPGAISERELLLNPQKYKNHLIIGYCTIGYRSGKLAEKLKKHDIRMVNLRGGILAWLHAGGAVHKDGKPINRVHVFGKKWDLAPFGVETVG